ncbi:MAG TPA: M14 family metallopeptidase [Iamia sp.]
MAYDFDRFLRYDELTTWLQDLVAAHPDLLAIESYGTSHEGRDLWLVTATDSTTGAHDTKPALWIDASIHAVELTGTVAACHVLQHLVDGHAAGDPAVVAALRSRTFYVVPRVNPDGAEWVLADTPRHRRSSTRPWPWADAHEWPGAHVEDVDGDGRILQMRIPDPDGGWMAHPDDARLLIPVPFDVGPRDETATGPRYRLLAECRVVDHDGFTVPTPRPPEGLDLNRNFPAGWGTKVTGSGDHPLSEPEILALVRAIAARPTICGYNAFHTSGGVLLRPSSTTADAELPPDDVWAYTELGKRGTELTGYPVHSVFEDFTWDRSDTMSGAADDWVYEHLGVFGWTTEFWDVIAAATDHRANTKIWYLGPTDEEALAVLRWCDENAPGGYVDWYPFTHPDLGEVELGGWPDVGVWTNPPLSKLKAEVAPHAAFAVAQALAAPCLELRRTRAVPLGERTWRVEAGVANTGWLPTDVSARARKNDMVRPALVELTGEGATVVGGPARQKLGQLDGRAALRFADGHDGTPDRSLATWVVEADPGTEVTVAAWHARAGRAEATLTLER